MLPTKSCCLLLCAACFHREYRQFSLLRPLLILLVTSWITLHLQKCDMYRPILY